MLVDKTRHPDQAFYVHPEPTGVTNSGIRVPDFIERRYDNMEEARSRDGSYDILQSQMKQILNFNMRPSTVMKSSIPSQNLPPIFETDTSANQDTKNEEVQQRSDNSDMNKYYNQEHELAVVSSSTNCITDSNNSFKHPLKHSWTFWYFDMNGGNTNWDENLKKVVDVNTIEDFWAVFHHMEDVSRLESGCDYALFKTGIRPMWEDPVNKEGGRWLLQLDRNQRSRYLDRIWLEIMLYLVGGDHVDSSTDDCINGAVVNIRNRADKVSLWLSIADKNQGHGPQILEVGNELKRRMDIPKHFAINFETHANVSTRRGSMAKSEFTL